MHIDIRTLVLVHSVVSVTLGGLMIAFWRAHRNMPGFGLWTAGTTLLGLSTLAAALRGVIPDFISIVVANAMGVASLAMFWNGIRQFNGKRARWAGPLAAIVAVAAVLAHRTYVENDTPDRIVVMSAVLAAECLLSAIELLRGSPRSMRGTAVPAAGLFGLVAFTLSVRAVSTAMSAYQSDPFASTLPQSVHYLVSVVSNILVVCALLIMAAQRLHRQVEERNADLKIARDRAEQATRARSEFLAMVSHEFRTPLNAIIGFSDVQRQELLGPLGNPRYREYADDINASGMHLLGLINTILDLSKVEAGKLEVRPTALDLGALLEEVVRVTRQVAEAKRVGLSIDVQSPPPACFADAQALKQILLNLLSNAVKFTPAGGSVGLGAEAGEEGILVLTVSDTGTGMKPEDIPRLLKPFEQADSAYARTSGGTGLGLPLVEALVRLHGGTLHIDSAVGRGTTVTIRLPGQPFPAMPRANG